MRGRVVCVVATHDRVEYRLGVKAERRSEEMSNQPQDINLAVAHYPPLRTSWIAQLRQPGVGCRGTMKHGV